MEMNSEEFPRYLITMLKVFTDDKYTLDTLQIGYSLYVLGRGQYVKDRYIEKKDPKKMIKKYVRARILLEELFLEFGAIEVVEEEFSRIDEYIHKKYLTYGAMIKISNKEAKEFLQKEYNFSDAKIIEIFKVYKEISERDPNLRNTFDYDKEEEKMINEYVEQTQKRIDRYITTLGSI